MLLLLSLIFGGYLAIIALFENYERMSYKFAKNLYVYSIFHPIVMIFCLEVLNG